MLRRYRLLFLALSAAILLLLAFTAYWSAAGSRMRSALADAPAKAMDTKGIALVLGNPVVDGFPLRLSVRLDSVRAQWPSGTLVETGPVTLWAWSWNPLEIMAESDGPLRLDLAGSARHAPVSGTAAALTGKAVLAMDGKPRQTSVELQGVRTEATDGLGALAAAEAIITWTAPMTAPAGPMDPQGQTSLLVRDLDLPGAVPPPLKPRIDQFALSLEARGPMPAKPSVEGMTAWRDGGGTLEVQALRVLWGGIDLRANATLALDRDMQPEGAGTAELSGGDALIDMLIQSGALKPEQGGGIKQTLGLLSQTTSDGRRVVAVPVTLQARRLSIGPVPVADLPVIPWN